MQTTSIEKFMSTIPGRKQELRALDAKLSESGKPKVLIGIDVIVDSLLRILMTPKGTEFMDPEFGSDVYKYIYELADDITIDDISAEVDYIVKTLETRAQIVPTISILPDQKGIIIDMVITFQGAKREVTVNVGPELLRSFDK